MEENLQEIKRCRLWILDLFIIACTLPGFFFFADLARRDSLGIFEFTVLRAALVCGILVLRRLCHSISSRKKGMNYLERLVLLAGEKVSGFSVIASGMQEMTYIRQHA